MELANKLLEGKFHEQDEDDGIGECDEHGNEGVCGDGVHFHSKQELDHQK